MGSVGTLTALHKELRDAPSEYAAPGSPLQRPDRPRRKKPQPFLGRGAHRRDCRLANDAHADEAHDRNQKARRVTAVAHSVCPPRWFLLRRHATLPLAEFRYRANHRTLLRRGQFRIYRQRQHLAASLLGHRQTAFFITERRETLLQVKRHWVINRGANLLVRQMFLQRVP